MELLDIKDLFPDSPIKMLKDVFEALKLYDLAELLEKATKPRALRPVISLKEMEKLPSANNRRTKIYTKAEVLIIDCSGCDGAGDGPKHFGSFFKTLSPQSEVTIMEAKVSWKLCEQLDTLMKEIKDISVTGQEMHRNLSLRPKSTLPVGDPGERIRVISKGKSALSTSLLSQTSLYLESETKEEQLKLTKI